MKVSCEIIKDLLPLYFDGVCSAQSKQLVDEHLSDCVDCQKELELMGGSICESERMENLDSAMSVKDLSIKWKRGMLKSVLKGVGITLVSIIALALILSIFIDARIVI